MSGKSTEEKKKKTAEEKRRRSGVGMEDEGTGRDRSVGRSVGGAGWLAGAGRADLPKLN